MSIHHLTLDGVSVAFADRRVLTDVSLTASPGERVGVVGENGSGKTTLLRVAAGELAPDGGTVQRPARVGLLHQELRHAASDTVADVLERAVAPVRRLTVQLEELGSAMAARPDEPALAERFADTLDEAEAAQAWALDARIHEAMAGLGLGGLARDRRVGAVSGGQRRRLALAALLLERPRLLVLDEPTNHLDDSGLDYLAEQLRGWGGPVLFASHDRAFLDAVVTTMLDLDPAPSAVGPTRQGVAYTGTYTDYLEARAGERRRWAERYASEQDELRRLRHEVAVGARDVFHTTTAKSEARIAAKFYGDRAATTIGRRVRSARSRLERLEAEQVRKPPEPLRFAGFGANRSGRLRAAGHQGSGRETLIAAQAVEVEGRLARVDVDVRAGDRLLVTGSNGSGKSTLLGVLAGRVDPTSGRRLASEGARIGLLTQHLTWSDAELALTPTQLFDRARVWPPHGLVHPRDVARPLADLSLGTRRRVALALLVADPPDVLLLDEPTNHLALALVEAVEAALPDYPGAVVLASHDRWLRTRWQGTDLHLTPISARPTLR